MDSDEERIISGIGHIAVLFYGVGLVINIALLVAYRNRSAFACRHLKQALALQVITLILSWVMGLYAFLAIVGYGLAGMPTRLYDTLLIGGIAVIIMGLIQIGLVIQGATRAFCGQPHRLPLIGRWVERIGSH